MTNPQDSNVIPFTAERRAAEIPLFVFVDLQGEFVTPGRPSFSEDNARHLANCRRLLRFARQKQLPIAHFRRIWKTAYFNAKSPFGRWISDFLPRPSEIVFERAGQSCYSAEDFTELLMEVSAPAMVIAGCSLESSVMSTVIEADGHEHDATVVVDACTCCRVGEFAESHTRAFLEQLLQRHAELTSTDAIVGAYSGLTNAVSTY